MKALWTGSDVIYATKYPKHSKKSKWVYMFFYKLFVKILDLFVEGHYIVSEHLRGELPKLKKPVSVLVDPPKHTQVFEKKPHKGLNVLYYRGLTNNQPFMDWVYGYDIFLKLKENLPDVNFIEVNGDADMAEIYPIVDLYIRPNRHDGQPRMIIECELNKIPYLWTKDMPNYLMFENFILIHK